MVTRDPDWAPTACWSRTRSRRRWRWRDGDVFVAGGATVYAATLCRYADALLISEIDLEPEGDTFYPEIDRGTWTEVSREPHEGFTVVRWERLAG